MHFLKYIFLQPLKSSLLVFLFSICKCRKMPSVQESDRASTTNFQDKTCTFKYIYTIEPLKCKLNKLCNKAFLIAHSHPGRDNFTAIMAALI